jgi:hypothetical protein
MSEALPLSIRDVGPGPEAARLTGETPDGLPSGVHTGGAWLLDGEVWKPLDGRPYMNSDCHYPTLEAEILEELAGEYLFPKNWRIEERNGRRFIVRKKAHLIPEDLPWSYLTSDMLLEIEQGIRNMNLTGWEMNDPIALAVDPDTYDLFLYDLSTAYKRKGSGVFAANEEWRIYQLFDRRFPFLAKLRRNARRVHHDAFFEDYTIHHVYASFNRPFSLMWASLPEKSPYLKDQKTNWGEAIPHTWIGTKAPLPQDVLNRYELKWGWSPLRIPEEQEEV